MIDIILKKSERDLEKERLNAEALKIATEILEANPDINVDYFISHVKNSIFSTTQCAHKLGISPRAFFRLRKKYNIMPVSMVKKSDQPKWFEKTAHSKAIRYYYSIYQLKRIPQSEIDLAQQRAAISLKLPGKIKWKPRGTEGNGKLKPKTGALRKNHISVFYDQSLDKYKVKDWNKKTEIILSKREVDKLNLQYARLKAFL